MRLTMGQIDLICEALAKAASRHESQSSWLGGGWFARQHDDKAKAMRELRTWLLQMKEEL
jgi:hypothetical protein